MLLPITYKSILYYTQKVVLMILLNSVCKPHFFVFPFTSNLYFISYHTIEAHSIVFDMFLNIHVII